MATDDDIEDLEREVEDALEEEGSADDTSGEKSPTGSSKRLTPAQWEEIKRHWELGDSTLADLSAQYGIRADTIQRRLKALGVQKGSRAHELAEVVEDEAKSQAVINTKRIKETKEQHYNWAEALAKLSMAEIVDAKKTNKPFSMVDANLAAINKAMKNLEIARRERWAILGLNQEDGDPDDMPELLISELTPEMIEQFQNQMRARSPSDALTTIDLDDDIDIEGEG